MSESNEHIVTITAADGATASIHLCGATVLNFTSASGKQALFCSNSAALDGTSSIRGGIPIVFPQFGEGKIMKHGFARTAVWSTEYVDNATGTAIFKLAGDGAELTSGTWLGKFELELAVTVYGESLTTTLSVHNVGDEEFTYEALQHSYYTASNGLGSLEIQGLAEVPYKDKTQDFKTVADDEADAVTFTGEVDRVYLNESVDRVVRVTGGTVGYDIRVQAWREDASMQRQPVEFVVWNPGADKGASMSDLHDGGFNEFVCVEPGAVKEPVSLAPEKTHSLVVVTTLEESNV